MISSELSVRQVMLVDPITVDPGQTVQHVLRLMNERRIGAVVVATDGRLDGIFTERDFLRRATTADPGWRDLPVAEWMTTDPYTIGPDAGWEEAVGMMDRLRVRHLPVIEHGLVIGIVSSRLLMNRRTDYLNRVVEERTQELRRANDLLIARDSELLFNLRAAGRLQTRLLLPNAPPPWAELGWGIHFAPLDHLGGDYYDFALPDADHLGILIADASGHSIPAAMVAVMARTAFADAARWTVRPGEVLAEMNRRLQGLTDERFVTAFYGVLNRRTLDLRYASAGHPPPLRFDRASGRAEPVPSRGFMLGIMPDEVYTEHTIRLRPGDRLCLYTDGITDCRNQIGEGFGNDRLQATFATLGDEPADRLAAGLLGEIKTFSDGHQPSDDMTLVVAEVKRD
jgi:serine phosphatase RsbU (regulator of sigma subunit)